MTSCQRSKVSCGCLGSHSSLQQPDCSLPVVPAGLLQRRAPPPGAQTELHHTWSNRHLTHRYTHLWHLTEHWRLWRIHVSSGVNPVSPVLQGAVRSSVLQQEADDLCVTFCSRHMQRRPAVVVDSVHIHPGQEVPADHQRRRDGQKSLNSLISCFSSSFRYVSLL